MELGIDSFAWALSADGSPIDPTLRMAYLLEEVAAADQAGLDAFGIGEHHRAEFLDGAPAIILAAAAARTNRIRLQSSVTVLGAADPVRVFQDFATIDLVSNGRAEIVAGRGSSIEAFPLYGRDLRDYDALFEENLKLLLQLREDSHPHWSGSFRAALAGQGVFPRPVQQTMPVWLGVGGTPASFVRAGRLGLPLMVAIIGGSFDRFAPLVDLYRQAYQAAGHSTPPCVGVHAIGFVGATDEEARTAFYPGWSAMLERLGPERGWSGPSRAQFDAMCGDGGTYLIGSARTVAAKLMRLSDMFGGIHRVNLQMSSASNDHDSMLNSIALLGEQVKPLVAQGHLAG